MRYQIVIAALCMLGLAAGCEKDTQKTSIQSPAPPLSVETKADPFSEGLLLSLEGEKTLGFFKDPGRPASWVASDFSRLTVPLSRLDPTHVLIADLTSSLIGRAIFTSSDLTRFAYAEMTAEGWRIVSDKGAGPSFAGVSVPLFSATGDRLAYTATDGKHVFVVLDGVRSEPYESVYDLSFSPAGKRFGFAARKGGRWYLIVDGGIAGDFSGVAMVHFDAQFESPRYAVLRDKKFHLVSGNAESEPFDALGELDVTEDGRVSMYSVQKGEHWYLYANGALIGAGASSLSRANISADGKRTAAWATFKPAEGIRIPLIDGKRWPALFEEPVGTPIFSEDGAHVGYSGFTSDGDLKSWVDGKVSRGVLLGFLADKPPVEALVNKRGRLEVIGQGLYAVSKKTDEYPFSFRTDDEGRLTIDAAAKMKSTPDLPLVRVAIGNWVGDYVTGIRPVTVAATTGDVAYAAQTPSGKWTMAVNHVFGPEYEDVSSARFGEDGNRIAYLAAEGHRLGPTSVPLNVALDTSFDRLEKPRAQTILFRDYKIWRRVVSVPRR